MLSGTVTPSYQFGQDQSFTCPRCSCWISPGLSSHGFPCNQGQFPAYTNATISWPLWYPSTSGHCFSTSGIHCFCETGLEINDVAHKRCHVCGAEIAEEFAIAYHKLGSKKETEGN